MKKLIDFTDAEKLILIEAIVSGGISQLTRSANYAFSVSDAKLNPDAVPLGRAQTIKFETVIQSNENREKPLKSLNTGLNYSFNDLELLQRKNKNQRFKGATADELTNRISLLTNAFKIFNI
jgi:hypothetical protein